MQTCVKRSIASNAHCNTLTTKLMQTTALRCVEKTKQCNAFVRDTIAFRNHTQNLLRTCCAHANDTIGNRHTTSTKRNNTSCMHVNTQSQIACKTSCAHVAHMNMQTWSPAVFSHGNTLIASLWPMPILTLPRISLPLIDRSTSPTAFAAPVADGMILHRLSSECLRKQEG